MTAESTAGRNARMYNDPLFNYAQFWTGRDYEHQAELVALRRLLAGRRYRHAADIGGGYGRLAVVLTEYADQVTLVDPSTQQLEPVPGDLPRPGLRTAAGRGRQAAVRRRQHRPRHHGPGAASPAQPGQRARGTRAHPPTGRARRRRGGQLDARGAADGRADAQGSAFPPDPVDLRSAKARLDGAAPYVNHHPRTIIGQLAAVGLEVRETLSASNFRHPLAKALVPQRALLAAERAVQRPLAGIRFGPSLFLLLEKGAMALAPS